MVNEQSALQSYRIVEQESSTFKKNVKVHGIDYRLRNFKGKSIDEIITYCSNNNLFDCVKDGHVELNVNTRVPRDIFSTINVVLDSKNYIVQACWVGQFSESGHYLEALNNPVALRTIDDLAVENKRFLNDVKSMVDKSKFQLWRDVENGYLPGIVSKLHKLLNSYNIDEAKSNTVNGLMSDVIQLADRQKRKPRSSLAFWKNSTRNKLTIDFMDAIIRKQTAMLANVNTKLLGVNSCNFNYDIPVIPQDTCFRLQ